MLITRSGGHTPATRLHSLPTGTETESSTRATSSLGAQTWAEPGRVLPRAAAQLVRKAPSRSQPSLHSHSSPAAACSRFEGAVIGDPVAGTIHLYKGQTHAPIPRASRLLRDSRWRNSRLQSLRPVGPERSRCQNSRL